MLLNCLFVGCGGFIGSVLRYLCGFIRIGTGGFPYVTLGVNMVGSFAILFLTGVFARAYPLDSHLMLFLCVGLCGGFTTFSTFSMETLGMLEQGEWAMGLAYAIASFILCVVAAYLGELCAGGLVGK